MAKRRNFSAVFKAKVAIEALRGDLVGSHSIRINSQWRTATGKPGGHPSTSNLCEDCHRTDSWANVTFNHDNVTGTCGSCHAGDFKPGPHKKTEKPVTIMYTVNELMDCTESCHMYTDNTFTTIEKNRNGPEHNPDRGEW